MTLLKWILDVYPRVRKRSTLDEYWRVWCMLYRKSVGKSLHAKVMEEVRDYIDGCLTIEYNLDTSVREKPVFSSIISGFWIHRSFRTNDNDEMELEWEDIKTLCYDDVTLLMLSNPEGKRDLLAMEVTLKYTEVPNGLQ
ncbi:uncharacterized protein Z518_01287 [Rhinocladiella mackenziei CBS 650.93]|uniref:Uncharacterized protein n=1 Tax=Rhinocladiella mackenziei CBS 650.93 TaxID=1442369 RepID=A0A0D2J3D0_9EURO|nr:uncharacterized protein Z518_01287 [Rhinocladiella mackenziei CBS 650.93]KIX10206.1 hypothetical protein Z518_01287 [Rhinocladiella mackenziei CBS 650.93]